MQKRRKYINLLVLFVVMSVLINSVFPFVSANDGKVTPLETMEQTDGSMNDPNNLDGAKEPSSTFQPPSEEDEHQNENSEDPENLSVLDSVYETESFSNSPQVSRGEDELQNFRLESMAHELAVLRMQAFEQGMTNLAKEIEKIENELVVEKKLIPNSITIDESRVGGSDNGISNVPVLNLEDKYIDQISKYKMQVLTAGKYTLESLAKSLKENEQTLTAGSDAKMFIRKPAIFNKVDIKVFNDDGKEISSYSIEQPTDTPTYIWRTPSDLAIGTYRIVFLYPDTTEPEDQFLIHLTSIPQPIEIDEANPVDVDLLNKTIKVYQFKPTTSEAFQITTLPNDQQMNEGIGLNSINDTWLGLYRDAGLTELVQYNEDSNGLFSEIITNLESDITYYLAVKSSNDADINVKLNISSVNYLPIYVNTPIDVQVPAYEYKVYQFCTPASGNYRIYTSSYMGNGEKRDTALWLYSDPILYNQLAYNDEANDQFGTFFSEIKWPMQSETCYYIKLKASGDYMTTKIDTRIKVESISGSNPIEFKDIKVNTPIDVSYDPKAPYDPTYYKFIPRESGTYTFFTGPYQKGTQHSDTKLLLYTEDKLSNVIASNDDIGPDNQFSSLTYLLTAGKTYYLVLKGKDDTSTIQARLTLIFGGMDLYEVNDSDETAYPIELDRVYQAQIARSDWEESYPETDEFQFISQEDETKYLSLQPTPNNKYFLSIYETVNGKSVRILQKETTSNLLNVSFPTKKGVKYFIIIQAEQPVIGNGPFYSFRLAINTFKEIKVNTPIDMEYDPKSPFEPIHYKFTPRESGTYTFFTGPYQKGTQHSDTKLLLYTEDKLSNVIASNDDIGSDNQFSSLTYLLTAGKTYYLVLKGKDDTSTIQARLTLIFGGMDLYEVNDSDGTAYPIELNRVYQAQIARSDWEETYPETDQFQFVSPDQGSKIFSLMPTPNIKYFLSIYEVVNGKNIRILQKDTTSNLLNVSFSTKKGVKYYITIQAEQPVIGNGPFYYFRLTPGLLNQTYTYTNSGKLDELSYELGLYTYEIKYQYDNNGNLTSRTVTKTMVLK